MTAKFQIAILEPRHDRKAFSSGVEPLDRYFHQQVTQDIRRRVTTCYVATDAATGAVAGYYTLAASSIPLADIPDALARRLPRYGAVPVARLGRLAVALAYRGRQLGASLLWDAALRAARAELGVFALLVDAKDDRAAAFYGHHGFVAVGERQLILSLTNVAALS